MKTRWRSVFHVDPIPKLLASGHPAIVYFTRRDLLEESVGSTTQLWDLKIPQAILRRQQPNGSWKYPGNRPRGVTDYDQIETYRELGYLIEEYGFDKNHPAIARAASYLFSRQTAAGEFHGIYGHQYSPNYSAAILELLIKAGYGNDPHIKRGFRWLLDIRQNDGGWAIPFRTAGRNLGAIQGKQIIEPDRTQPFSHLITGIVLRAFAAHPTYAKSATARSAANLLVSRFFQRDVYPDRNRIADWTGCTYPFWMTDIVSSLESVTRIGLTLSDPNVSRALQWLVEHQDHDGMFAVHHLRARYHDMHLWMALAICRIAKRLG